MRNKLETAERIRQMEQEARGMMVQMQNTREEAIVKGAYEGQNVELIEENQRLREEIQGMRSEVEKMMVEKEGMIR